MVEISFILAIYNAERTLRECLTSILQQDYPKEKYEIVIVDGGSKDATLSIIQEFMQKSKNIRLLGNPYRLSEGMGMGKDQGLQAAKGDIVIYIDHDNILVGKNWIHEIMTPLLEDKEIMVSQSLLTYAEDDTLLIKYLNAAGVEDPFAIPYSLVSAVTLHPEKFTLMNNTYYIHELQESRVLYGGANGCAYRKSVFQKIGGYQRDVDVFAKMARWKMKVAIPKKAYIHHKTSADLWSLLIKKGKYFYSFINSEYHKKEYRWVGKSLSGKFRFMLMAAYNLSLIGPFAVSLKYALKTGRLFWLLHPFYMFLITFEYGLITLFRIKNFFTYALS